MRKKISSKYFVIGSVCILLILTLVNVTTGSFKISFQNFLDFIFNGNKGDLHGIIIQSRLNSVITAVLAGAGLAVGGLLLQTLFKNPLADPSVLGISSGSSVGVAICLLALGTTQTAIFSSTVLSKHVLIIFSSILGTMPVLLVLLLVSKRTSNKLVILITGLMISFVNSSLVSIVEFFSMKESLYSYMLWGMGSFSNVPPYLILSFALILIVVILLSLFLAKPLNAALFGDNYAKNLGVNLSSLRFWTILFSGVIIAVVTAYCGPIGFIGLAVPHIVRMFTKTADHHVLIPACVLFGSCFALFCLFISRIPGFDGALPINVITSLIGAPILIKIMFTPSMKNQND
ncbi:MAG: iron ABC transporter permease [Bacteroidales bacterium]|jgi:iron complex transport system permease protein|nr:iron ABC transporter permease [Bacteroidales bacterium]